MSDVFRKFIETGGKTTAEIKRSIEALLRGEVENAVRTALEKRGEGEVINLPEENAENYHSEKIPPRKEERYVEKRNNRPTKAETYSYSSRGIPLSVGRPMEDVPPDFSRAEDEAMYAKIAEMRRLDEIYYTGALTYKTAVRAMINQGGFMADVSDDYNHRAFCAVPRPIYGALSSSQLRTYFTWRTDARRGKFVKIDEPYIQLYCCELLNKIGVNSSGEAADRLLELWKCCRSFSGTVARDMPRLIKDFYAFNDLSAHDPDPIAEFRGGAANEYVSELYEKNYSKKLSHLAARSSYNIKSSAFYSEQSAALLDGALEAVLTALDGYFKEKGVSLFELICGRLKKDLTWKPFLGYYVDLARMDGFREVKISPVERYCVKRGEPALECFESAPFKGFIGYVLKSTEMVLRERTGFRHKISADIKMALNDFTNREKFINAVISGDMTDVIAAAVNGWCDKNNIMPKTKTSKVGKAKNEEHMSADIPVKVEIDVTKLAKIREESDEIAQKLISVDEEALNDTPSEDEICEIAEKISDEEFSEKIAECSAEILSQEEKQTVAPSKRKYDFSQLPDEWQEFANALNDKLLGVLSALNNGDVASYCRNRGILPEVIFEDINTPALMYISDVVIENGEIVPDYLDNIKDLLECAGMLS